MPPFLSELGFIGLADYRIVEPKILFYTPKDQQPKTNSQYPKTDSVSFKSPALRLQNADLKSLPKIPDQYDWKSFSELWRIDR